MIWKKIKKLIIYITNLPLYYISKLIPKDKNLWVFGAWFGEKYADNSKYLFEYVNKYHPEINAVWMTNNKKVFLNVKKRGYNVCYKYSFYGILIGLKAGVSIFVQDNKNDNICFLNNGTTKLIQLWHGIPLKKIGKDDKKYSYKNYNKNKEELKRKLFPFIYENFNLMISSSEEDKNNFLSAFSVKNIKVTGYPRNDFLIKNKNLKNKKNFNVIYLPTFRGNIGNKIDLFSLYDFNLECWINFLRNYNINFYIKMHPVNFPTTKIVKKFSQCKNIIFMENKNELYEILYQFDILITDYSSIYFDYLLLDRPIIFTPFDYKEYIERDREFYYNYNEVTPGPKCKNWNEVMEWIKKFKENPTLYSKERKKNRNRFHKYQDDKSCERVYQEISKLLMD